MEPQPQNRKELYRVLNVGDQKLTIGADRRDGIFIYDKTLQAYMKDTEGFLVYFARRGRTFVVPKDFKRDHVKISAFIGMTDAEEQRLVNIVEHYLANRSAIVERLIMCPPSMEVQPPSSIPRSATHPALSWFDYWGSTEPYHTPLEEFDEYDYREATRESYEEASDYNDSASRSHDSGWFYSDGDD
jgi:hypothetical protein